MATLNKLMREKALNDANGNPFWPEKLLEEIISLEHIKTALKRTYKQPRDLEDLASTIKSSYLKVFAILTLIEKNRDILKFQKQGVNDESLPLVQIGGFGGSFALRSEPRRALDLFRAWKICEKQMFEIGQFRVNPAYLGSKSACREIQHEDFKPRQVMPFLEDEIIGKGSYGTIHKVEIDKRCHGFEGVLRSIITDNSFALKRIPRTERGSISEEIAFRKEVEALRRFSGFQHEHLVTLLMTWTVKDHYCLLFPLADKDLDKYCEDKSPLINAENSENQNFDKVCWLARQIAGMAGALNTIHQPPDGEKDIEPKTYGRHGDIKLENVLWYKSSEDSRGILVLSDFGHTSFNTASSRSNVPNKDVSFSPDCRPPECDLEEGVLSQAFDIWTFGCLLLELCCWALGGSENRAEFKTYRTTRYITGTRTPIFFQFEKKDDSHSYVFHVKKEVNNWIARLHKHALCTRYFHDLLDLIEDEMIVTISANKKRIRSDALFQKVSEFAGRGDSDRAYYDEPQPDSREAKYEDPVDAILNQKAVNRIV